MTDRTSGTPAVRSRVLGFGSISFGFRASESLSGFGLWIQFFRVSDFGFTFGCRASDPNELTVSSRAVGGSGHRYNSLLKPAGGSASSQQIDYHLPCLRFLMAPWAPREAEMEEFM